MKMIQAVLRQSVLEDVKKELTTVGVGGITALQAVGFGKQRGFVEVYRGVIKNANFLPKIIIEVVVEDDKVEPVIEAIQKVAHTGEPGDGKIFVIPVEDVVRIRTGERGSKAL